MVGIGRSEDGRCVGGASVGVAAPVAAAGVGAGAGVADVLDGPSAAGAALAASSVQGGSSELLREGWPEGGPGSSLSFARRDRGALAGTDSTRNLVASCFWSRLAAAGGTCGVSSALQSSASTSTGLPCKQHSQSDLAAAASSFASGCSTARWSLMGERAGAATPSGVPERLLFDVEDML